MNLRLSLLLLSLPLSTFLATAQAVVNTQIERNIPSDNYIRLNYGNDYFTATDYYNTQNILLEYTHPKLGLSPIFHTLYHPETSEIIYGMAIEHNAYTPRKYERTEIQLGDRPFAGALFFKAFSIAKNITRNERITTSLSAGIVGQGAGAKQMQVFIHENTKNIIPQGWHNQVRNDVVLNYEMIYQRQLLAIDNFMCLSADAMGRVGTLSTKASVGLTIMAGYFQNPFATINIKGRKIQFFAYDHPEVSVVGYDATLQGGLLNKKSPYIIEAGDITRFTFRNNWGLALKIGKVHLEYYQSFITKEFNQGMDFRNGGIQIGWNL